MTTDTPRTDAARFEALRSSAFRQDCIPLKLGQELERELAASLENQVKALTEIKEIRNALGDDGRRTHKEILEMAFKASGWREWKKKYIDLRNAHIAEGQDPAGTIWEHADKLQKEIKETKAEVERLKKELADWDYGTRAEREQKRAEKAEADVAKLNHQLLKTESELLQSQDINSFLDTEFKIACKRAEKAEAELSMWRDGGIMHEDHSKEIDELNQKLDTAIEIAKDALWYARIYENEIHFNKMDGLYQKLVALKNK